MNQFNLSVLASLKEICKRPLAKVVIYFAKSLNQTLPTHYFYGPTLRRACIHLHKRTEEHFVDVTVTHDCSPIQRAILSLLWDQVKRGRQHGTVLKFRDENHALRLQYVASTGEILLIISKHRSSLVVESGCSRDSLQLGVLVRKFLRALAIGQSVPAFTLFFGWKCLTTSDTGKISSPNLANARHLTFNTAQPLKEPAVSVPEPFLPYRIWNERKMRSNPKNIRCVRPTSQAKQHQAVRYTEMGLVTAYMYRLIQIFKRLDSLRFDLTSLKFLLLLVHIQKRPFYRLLLPYLNCFALLWSLLWNPASMAGDHVQVRSTV